MIADLAEDVNRTEERETVFVDELNLPRLEIILVNLTLSGSQVAEQHLFRFLGQLLCHSILMDGQRAECVILSHLPWCVSRCTD